jgi:hypothetical protein
MSTLKEIIYTIKNIKAGGVQTDDVKLSDENYADVINYYRAKLVRQEIDRGYRLDPTLIQSITADGAGIEVERVKFDRGSPLSGKTVYKTIIDIPRAIETTKNNLITFVGNNLLGKPFQRSTPYKVGLDSARALTGLEPKWFEFNKKIYVVTEDSLKYVTIQLVAEDPLAVLGINKEVDVYDPLNVEYPMSNTMRDSLYKLIADGEYKIMGLEDTLNDGLDQATNENRQR